MPIYGVRSLGDLSGSVGRFVREAALSHQLEVNTSPGTISLGILTRVYSTGGIQWGEVTAGRDFARAVTGAAFALGVAVTNDATGRCVAAVGLDFISGVSEQASVGADLLAIIQPFSTQSGAVGPTGPVGPTGGSLQSAYNNGQTILGPTALDIRIQGGAASDITLHAQRHFVVTASSDVSIGSGNTGTQVYANGPGDLDLNTIGSGNVNLAALGAGSVAVSAVGSPGSGVAITARADVAIGSNNQAVRIGANTDLFMVAANGDARIEVPAQSAHIEAGQNIDLAATGTVNVTGFTGTSHFRGDFNLDADHSMRLSSRKTAIMEAAFPGVTGSRLALGCGSNDPTALMQLLCSGEIAISSTIPGSFVIIHAPAPTGIIMDGPLHVDVALYEKIHKVSGSNYQIRSDDVVVGVTGIGVTGTFARLPNPALVRTDWTVTVQDFSGAASALTPIKISRFALETVNGAAGVSLNTPYATSTLRTDGVNWFASTPI